MTWTVNREPVQPAVEDELPLATFTPETVEVTDDGIRVSGTIPRGILPDDVLAVSIDHDHDDPTTCPVCHAPGHRVLVPRYICPVCKCPAEAVRGLDGDDVPNVGDLSVCSECGHVSEFTAGLDRVPVDRARLSALVAADPTLKRLVKLSAGIRLGFLGRLTR